MSTTEVSSDDVGGSGTAGRVDTNLEVIVLPVSDVDRAKEFYRRLGWRLDADVIRSADLRLIQFTPPGSGCSIQFGTGLDLGGARIGPGPLPRRLRRRGRARRARRSRRRGQRGVP